MPERHIGRYIKGPSGMRRMFKQDRTLRRLINPGERKYILGSLDSARKSGGGINREELLKSYHDWRRNTDDPISRTEARIVKDKLDQQLSNDTAEARADHQDYLARIRSDDPPPIDPPPYSSFR